MTGDPRGGAQTRRHLLRSGAMLGAGAALWALPGTRAWASLPSEVEARWPRVGELLERYVSGGRLPGAVAALGWGDGPLGAITRGKEGFGDADWIGPDSLFRVYSMTKPITGMAAMILIDEGRMGLDQPLADILPEFARMQVAIDPAKSLRSRPAQNLITIRHLLTHTAGFGYAGIGKDKPSLALLDHGVTPAIASRRRVPGLTPPVPTPGPEEFLRRAARIPLLFEPGTRWSYSMGLDILGLAIQRASGAASFADFLHERIFAPAGMTSSWFRVPASEVHRLSANYGLSGKHRLLLDGADDSIYLDPTPFAFGGAGLVTSPADYDRFLRMLVGRGVVDGRRVMSERAVMLGTSDLLPPGADTSGTLVAGAGFGAGGRVGKGADEGHFGWSGAAGTVGFVHMKIGLRAGLYVQFMPPGALPIQREFMDAARDDVLARMRG